MNNLLPWALVDEEPEMLISELGLSYYPLHPPTEEEAMNQYSPPSYFTAEIGHGSSVQSGSVAIPSHVHEPFQPQLAPFHDGLFHAVLPSQVSRHHNSTHEPTRQNNIRRRRKIDATERAEIRAYHLEHREFKQQQIADTFGCDRSTISKILREENHSLTSRRSPAIDCLNRDHLSEPALAQPEAAIDGIRLRDRFHAPGEIALRSFEDSNAPSREAHMNPKKEDARRALEIALKGLELHIGLNESEYSIFRKMRRYLDPDDRDWPSAKE